MTCDSACRQTRPDPTTPFVSVVMANFRGADFIATAIRSVLAQTHARLELIVSDDASDDESCAIVRRIAAEDLRVRLIAGAVNGGPSRARNAALDVARGDWIAIVDSDDLLHPERIANLLSAAERHGADMVADDMVPFGAGLVAPSITMFGRRLENGVVPIGAIDLIGTGGHGLAAAELGYLKPMIRRVALDGVRYDESLRNGEDFDLYLRLVLGGAHFVLMPDPTYLYRRHGASISHRLTEDVLAPLLAAQDALALPRGDPEIGKAMALRREALRHEIRYARLVTAIKMRAVRPAALLMLRHPALTLDLLRSLIDRQRRRAPGDGEVILEPHWIHLTDLAASDDGDANTIGFRTDPGSDGLSEDASPAVRLCAVWAGAPPNVVVCGAAGFRGLGYLPGYRTLELRLSSLEAEAFADRIPADAAVRIVDHDASGIGNSIL